MKTPKRRAWKRKPRSFVAKHKDIMIAHSGYVPSGYMVAGLEVYGGYMPLLKDARRLRDWLTRYIEWQEQR